MWKFLAGAFGFLGMAWTFSNAFGSAGSMGVNKPLDEVISAVAADMNSKRGTTVNGMVIEGAKARGNTLIVEIIVPNAPKRYNTDEASIRATQNMVSMYCNSKFAPHIRRGAVIVHRFQSKSGLELVDGRLDASTCKYRT